jgi:hypothetical protein
MEDLDMTTTPKTPDYIHNPTALCSCNIEHHGKTERIVYCARHAAVPELLAFVDRITDQACARYAGKRPWHASCDCAPCDARALLARIQGD